MTVFGIAFAAAVRTVIVEAGRTVTLTSITHTGAPTPANPSGTVQSSAVAGKAIVESYRQDEIDGTTIQGQDRKIMMAPADFPTIPDTSDTLTIDGVAHTIVSVREIRPGTTSVLYMVQARA